MTRKIASIISSFILVLILSFPLSAQEADPYLSKFFAVQVDETVLIRWTISAGNTCSDTYIERSSDGIAFEKIGIIGGVCGSPYESITYDYIDTMPLTNRTSYYRLILGYYGYTSPKSLEFVRYNEKGYFVGPNPFSDFTRISFENKEEEEYQLIITDMHGRKVTEMMTTGNEFIIRRDELGAGVFIVDIYKGNVSYFRIKINAV